MTAPVEPPGSWTADPGLPALSFRPQRTPPPPASPALAALLLVLLALPGGAATATLTPVGDTTLFSRAGGSNNLGGTVTLVVGTTAHHEPARALLRFDPAAAMPAGATVLAIELHLTLVKEPDAGGPGATIALHRLLRSWGEGGKSGNLGAPAGPGEATWRHRRFDAELWSAPGAAAPEDFTATPSAVIAVDAEGAYPIPSTPGLVEDVTAWLADPAANHGWILIGQAETTNLTARRFASRENAAGSPRLLITYSGGPPPPIIRRYGRVGDRFELQFTAFSGNIYDVEYLDAAGAADWAVLTNIVAKLQDLEVLISEPLTVSPQRFYRVADVADID